MSSSISPTSAFFARGSLLGSWQIGRASPVSIQWYTVSPSIVIAVLTKMSPYSVRSSSSSQDLASLRFGLVSGIMSCNFQVVTQTCGCSTLGGVTSMTGSQCARWNPFMSFCSWQVAFRTLMGSSQQSWNKILPITTPSHCKGYHLITGHCQAGRPGSTPGLRRDTSASARYSVWCPRSTNASYVCRMSSPWWIHLWYFNEYRKSKWAPPQGVRETSFTIGRSSPDTICSVSLWFHCLSCHLAAMSGLTTVTYAQVSMVTGYGLSPTQPCATRLGSALSVMSQHVVGGALMLRPACPLFRQQPLLSW
jgi:hypothetical protein